MYCRICSSFTRTNGIVVARISEDHVQDPRHTVDGRRGNPVGGDRMPPRTGTMDRGPSLWSAPNLSSGLHSQQGATERATVDEHLETAVQRLLEDGHEPVRKVVACAVADENLGFDRSEERRV